jgi:hypothetical protein
MIPLLVLTPHELHPAMNRTYHRGDNWPSMRNSLATHGPTNGHQWRSSTGRRQTFRAAQRAGDAAWPAGVEIVLSVALGQVWSEVGR